jgi:Ala-tRNA(Pro) deacylase
MALAAKLETFLREHQVDFTTVPHPKTYTSHDAATTARVPEDHVAKGVVVADGERFHLVLIPGDRWLRLGAVGEALGREVRLATDGEVERLFDDCDAGAVPPLGAPYGLHTLIDEGLTSLADVYMEAGDHRTLIHVPGDRLRRLTPGARTGHFAQAD